MGEILIRAILLAGRHPADGDGHCPLEWHVEETYKKVDEFLKKHGQPVVGEQINYFPHIDDGFITPAVAASCYIVNNCLVGNLFHPYGLFTNTGVIHKMIVGGKVENLPDIKKACNLLWEASDGSRWLHYWKIEKDRVIQFPGNLDSVVQALPYVSKLLTE